MCLRRGLGASNIDRDDLPRQAPRALEEKARIRWLRAVEQVTSPRDRCIALIPYYAGARISEVVRLDTGDVRRSARKGVLRIYGKGNKVREVPIHAKLRPGLEQWLTERAAWPGADTSPALFLNTKGGRLSARAAGGIIAAIAEQAALDDDPTAHVLRHTFATSLVRGKTNLVVVAELMGHSRLDTTRQRCPPNRTKPTRLTTSPPTTEVTNRKSGPYWAHQHQPMAGFARISVIPLFRLPRSKCSERTAAEQTAIAYTPLCGVRRSQADSEASTTLAG